MSLSVLSVNDVPFAGNDVISLTQDSSAVSWVLANDADDDGDDLTVAAVSDPPHGAARSNPDKSVTYRPDAGFSGSDSFAYDVSDGQGGVSRATVDVVVQARKSPQVPLSWWTYPGTPKLDGFGTWVVPINEPVASGDQMRAAYQYSQTFWFSDLRASGTISLGAGDRGRTATFTVTRADGSVDRPQISYPWVAGRGYYLLVYHLGHGVWGGWVIDGATGAMTMIGTVPMSPTPQYQSLYPASLTYVTWSGPPTADCRAYPRAQVLVLPPDGFAAGRASTVFKVSAAKGAGDCPATSLDGPGWVYYALGDGV